MANRGKRVGPKRKARFQPTALLLCFAVTVAVIAWGYLVKAAIDFGIEGRSGDSGAWLYLGLACLGAVACLFIGLMLVARLLRVLGITGGASAPSSASATDAAPPPADPPAEAPDTRAERPGGSGSSESRSRGGRRAAR